MYKKDVSPSDWGKILRDFGFATKSKKYKRVDYRTIWTKIAKPIRNVHIEVQENDISIMVDDNNRNEVILSLNDGTLGEFLYDTFLLKEEKSMPPRNDNETLVYDALASTLDDLISSAKLCDKATTACAITAGDITKVCDGLHSDSTTAIDWNNYGAVTLYDPIEANKGALSTRSYNDIEIATRPTFEDVKKIVKEEMKNNNNNEEKKEMKGFNFDFGPCTSDQVRMSMYGIAVKNAAGTYVSYNPKSGEIVDVDVLNFDGSKYMYKMPVAIADVREGQVIIHNKDFMFVMAINENGTIDVIDIRAGEHKTIYPQKSPFGFNFITRVISLFDGIFKPASNNNPFGNMLPFMMLSGDNKDFDMKDMLMFNMATGNNDFAGNINPMMLMLMMDNGKNDKSDWLMPFMLMNNGMMGHNYQCVKSAIDVGQN